MSGPKISSIVSSRDTSETLEFVDVDEAVIDAIVEGNGTGPEAVIPILQAIRTRYRYLPSGAWERELSEITPASIQGVATLSREFLCDRNPR